jgi:hypothetical protein
LGTQEPLGSTHTHREQLTAMFFAQPHMTAPLQIHEQFWQIRHQAFGANVCGCSPGQEERLLDLWTVDWQARALDGAMICRRMIEQPNRRFTGIARHLDERIQDEILAGQGGRLILRSHPRHQFLPRLIAQRKGLIRHLPRLHVAPTEGACF